jgi:hypothetical protein
MNKNRWWCMDCRAAVQLNRHGRCGTCESEAVDPVNQTNALGGQEPTAHQDLGDSASCS